MRERTVAGKWEKVHRPKKTSKKYRRPLQPAYRWEMLVWLWFAFLLNQADRALFGVLLPPIQKDLGLSDGEAGLIASVLLGTLALLVPFAEFVSSVCSKRRIVTACLAFWSLATIGTGLSRSVISLVLVRGIATGGGEAFYAPAATALISRFHRLTRSLALFIHQTGLYVGIILSGFIGGWIADRWSWQTSFYFFGGTGVFLAFILFFRLHETPNREDGPDEKQRETRPSVFRVLEAICNRPTAMVVIIAFSGVVFVNNAYLVWAPTFLKEKFDMNLSEAGGFSMLYHHLWALVGIIIGGPLTDVLVRIRRGFRLGIQGACLLMGAPFIVLMGLGHFQSWIYVGMGGFGLFRGLFESSIYTSLHDVIEPKLRRSATGLMTFFAFTVGAFAPWILGLVKPVFGLSSVLASLSIVYAFGGFAILATQQCFFRKDYYDEGRDMPKMTH